MPKLERPDLLDGGFHHHLLRDEARLRGYAAAIAATVRPGDVVADIGAGSGILSWLCRKAGARRVLAVEANTRSYPMLLRNVRRNGATGDIIPILADGTEWRPAEPVDVVVCELMETALLHEPIAAVMRNVHAWPSKPRAILPSRVELQVEGVALREDFLGYKAALPGFRATGGDDALTDLATYAVFDFGKEAPPERCVASFALVARRDGEVSGLQLRTTTRMPGAVLGESPGYCTPLALPLDAPIPVRAGDPLEGSLAYEFSYTSEPLEYALRRSA